MSDPSDPLSPTVAPVVERIRSMLQSGSCDVPAVIPYADFLGVRVERVDGDIRGHMAFADHLIGNPTLPALHGGTLGALLELTAVCKVLFESRTVVLPKTVTITVQYLRGGRPVDTYARSIITKQGRRIVNVKSEAWQDDPARPIATADAHFLIVPARSE
jgi:acyl-coenzyme A thioesterase PaaI-like protein